MLAAAQIGLLMWLSLTLLVPHCSGVLIMAERDKMRAMALYLTQAIMYILPGTPIAHQVLLHQGHTRQFMVATVMLLWLNLILRALLFFGVPITEEQIMMQARALLWMQTRMYI